MNSINDCFNIILMDYADKKTQKALSLFVFLLMIFPFINKKVMLFRESSNIKNIIKNIYITREINENK